MDALLSAQEGQLTAKSSSKNRVIAAQHTNFKVLNRQSSKISVSIRRAPVQTAIGPHTQIPAKCVGNYITESTELPGSQDSRGH